MSSCVHCALPLWRARARALPLGRGRARFCCAGCALAHALLGADVGSSGPRSDKLLARVIVSAFLSMGVMVFSLSWYGDAVAAGAGDETAGALLGLARLAALALATPVVLLLGVPLAAAVVATRRVLSADGLVVAGVSAAYGVSLWSTFADGEHVYFETVAGVLVLVGLGRWLDVSTRERAARRLAGLAAERGGAVRVDAAGDEREVGPDDLCVGDLVRVRPGEVVAVDGRVERGRSFVETADLSGEELPRVVAVGERVLAGMRVVDGSLDVRAEAVHGGRVRDEIERLLAESLASRPRLVRLADRVAGAFLPLVLAIAAGAFVWHARRAGVAAGLQSSLAVVLIACPCALGLATPLAFWVALGEAWRRGVLIRGGEVLERLARVRRAFLDKTGTLTTGELELRAVRPRAESGLDEAGALRLAAALEWPSEHPLARAVRRAWGGGELPEVAEFRAVPGVGVEGVVAGRRLELRRARTEDGVGAHDDALTSVVLADERGPLAELRFAATMRPEAAGVVARLAERGLAPRVLTGDGARPAAALADALGVPVDAELLPAAKARVVRAAGPAGTLFVGDGLNDAVALAAADVGVAVHGASPRSLDAAPVHLMRSDLGGLEDALVLARRAVLTARVNLAWAFGYNAIGVGLAAAGKLSPLFAASAMVASSAFVVACSMRIARAGRRERPGFAPAPERRLEPRLAVGG